MPIFYPNLTIVMGGNTAGATASVSSGVFTLAGGNNITLSQAGNAITISTPNNFNAGVSTGGNAAGTTGTQSVQLILAGGNNITLSQATGAGGNTITISAFNQTVQTQNFIAAVIGGNTAGATASMTSGTMTIAGGSNITLSQAGNAVSINAGYTLGYYNNIPFGTSASISQNQTQLQVFPLANDAFFPGYMTVSTVLLNLSGGSHSSRTNPVGATFSFGIYSLSASSTLNLMYSATTAYTTDAISRATSNNGFVGNRWFPVTQWSTAGGGAATIQLTPGPYWMGINCSTSGTGVFNLVGNFFMGGSVASQRQGTVGVNTSTTISGAGVAPALGVFNTAGLPTTLNINSLTQNLANAAFVPQIIFNNNQSSF